MENKGRKTRLISIICVLTLIILTILPGCNFIGQTKKNDGAADPVIDQMGNQLCCPVCQSTNIKDNGDGTYKCNDCGKEWKYDQTVNQIDVIDQNGNTIGTLDTNAGYVNGGSNSGGSYTPSNGGGSYTPSNGGGSNNNGGNNSSTTKPSSTKFDYKKFAQDLNASLKRFSESVKFVYDPDTDSWTVVSKDGKDTGLFGFKYSMKDQVFYTAEDAWQRNFGFEETYDNVSGAGAISYDTMRVKFNYNNKEWMMQYWKGQYGFVLIGAELGLYNREPGATNSTYYDCVTDAEKLNMSVKVYRQDTEDQNKYNLLFHRSPTTTWWLTGFTPGTLSAGSYVVNPDQTAKLKAEYVINFQTPEQAKAFVGGLENTTTIDHNSPKRSRSIKFTGLSLAEYEASSKSAKYAVSENGLTVYMSWR
ncbi:MAG TPA: hypothetical protein DCY15_00055 [Ruminococcaceae bacterium]|nr:hypothetical protein [Oscillospiraceae bacterium]